MSPLGNCCPLEMITWKCTQISQPHADFCSAATQNVNMAVLTDCGNSTARSKPQPNMKGVNRSNKFEQNGTNLNNSKPTNHLSTKPFTAVILLWGVFFQILRRWIWSHAKSTPHSVTLCKPFGTNPAVSGFVAARTLVGGLSDVSCFALATLL